MSNELIVQQKAKTLQALLEVSKKQIEAALPRHLTPERMLRVAMTEARKNPALLDCTQASFIGAIIQVAQLGLEPGGLLGHAYLIPFKNNKAKTTECQLIVGYKGMMDLAYRSPKVSHVIARAVYEGDTFEYEFGTNERLVHIPDPEANGKKLTHVYGIVFLKEGGKIFDVMESKEINAARGRSKSPDSGPWETDFESMAKKSVIRRMFKYMPVSIELQNAIGIDEAAERGEQDHSNIIEGFGKPVVTQGATEAFKENMVDDQKEPAKPIETTIDKEVVIEDGAFKNFAQEPVPTFGETKIKNTRTRAELTLDLITVAEEKGYDLKKLGDQCRKVFKTNPMDLTNEQMAELIESFKVMPDKKEKK